MDNIRVLHTVSTLREEAGGTTRSVALLCDALANVNVEVSLVTQRAPADVKPLPVLPEDSRVSVVIGPGEEGYVNIVRGLIDRLGLGRTVHLGGAVTDAEKWGYYARSELFVLPNLSEDFGLVIGEALAAQLPVITTTATPWRQINDHRCGWWIEVDAGLVNLCDALTGATSRSRGELQQMGLRGRVLVDKHFTWPKVAADMRTLFSWILGGPRPSELLQT